MREQALEIIFEHKYSKKCKSTVCAKMTEANERTLNCYYLTQS